MFEFLGITDGSHGSMDIKGAKCEAFASHGSDASGERSELSTCGLGVFWMFSSQFQPRWVGKSDSINNTGRTIIC